MAGGFPLMRAYRPAPAPETVASAPVPPAPSLRPARQNTHGQHVSWAEESRIWSDIRAHAFERYQAANPIPIPPTTAFRPAISNTKSRRAGWIQESKEWSRGLVPKIEQCRRQRRIRAERAQHRAEVLRQRQEAQGKAQAEINARGAELSSYKLMWSLSCVGLVISAFLFLMLCTNAVRDTQGSRLGVTTTCDLVPSLTDGSKFCIAYWTAIAVYIISRLAAPMAAANLATSSEVLGRANAAYYRRQSESCKFVNHACDLMAAIPLVWGFALMLRGKCGGEICLDLALLTPAVMSSELLGSIVGLMVHESGCPDITGRWKRVFGKSSSKTVRREASGKTGSQLLSQDRKDRLERG